MARVRQATGSNVASAHTRVRARLGRQETPGAPNGGSCAAPCCFDMLLFHAVLCCAECVPVMQAFQLAKCFFFLRCGGERARWLPLQAAPLGCRLRAAQCNVSPTPPRPAVDLEAHPP